MYGTKKLKQKIILENANANAVQCVYHKEFKSNKFTWSIKLFDLLTLMSKFHELTE